MLRKTRIGRLLSPTSQTVPHAAPSWRGWTLIALAAVGISACAVSSVQPLTVPLVYSTAGSKKPALAGSYPCAAVKEVRATDARTDKTLGMRTHESKPLKAELTASGDAAAWVDDGVHRYLAQTGIQFGGSGPTLDVALDSLRASESIWHRASYEGRVSVTAHLVSPSGKPCWQDDFDGTSGDYGYAGNIQTYQGTLNGALDAASLRLSESSGFRNALCHCGG
jgi:hypothetical protein